jgi:shikimate kinase
MAQGIILIGPDQPVKRATGVLLAERVGLPYRPLGPEKHAYYQEHGFEHAAMERLMAEATFDAAYAYTKPFDAGSLEHSLRDQPAAVLELDEMQSVYEDPELFARAQAALRPYQHVVLLMPSLDPEESARLLDQQRRVLVDSVEIEEHFVKHHSNHDLATITVYTQGKTPQETSDEILQRVDPSQPNIILIGPIGAGKSTIGRLLAERLGRPEVALDQLRWEYYKEIGFDQAEQQRIGEREGFGGVYRYWKRFEIHAVERVLAEHHGIIHFGAGHSVFEDADQFARARAALAPYANVVLLLPSPDLDESTAILQDRMQHKVGGVELTRHLLTHPSNGRLATLTVATDGRTPEEICDEIMRRCGFSAES